MKRILVGSALLLSTVLPAVVLGAVGSANAAAAGSGTDTKTGTTTAVKPGTKTGTTTAVKPGTKTGTTTAVKPGTKTGTTTAVKPGTKTGSTTAVKTGTKTGTTTAVKPGTKTGTTTAVKPGTKTGSTSTQPAVTLPSRLVVSGTTLRLTGSLSAGAPGSVSAAAARSLSLWFVYPGSATAVKIGGVDADSNGMLTVTAQLNAARITMGLNTIQIRNTAASGATTTQAGSRSVTVDVRRRSRVRITQVVFQPTATGFAVAAAVKVTHFDPKTARYIDSRLSPVRLQELVAGTWVTQATVTTNALGLATATFSTTAGRHTYRAVRPDGATVWSATSPETTVRTPTPATA